MKLPDVRIETPRLPLRLPAAADFEAWAAFAVDEEATRFVGGVQHRAMAWRSFVAMVGSWAVQGFAMFSVIERDSGRWVGRGGPWMPEGWPGTEVGWSIARGDWGKGYATEAATAAIGWAFDTLGWDEVIHTIAPENHASQVVASRLGARNLREDRLPPPMDDKPIDIRGQTRTQWRARRRGEGDAA